MNLKPKDIFQMMLSMIELYGSILMIIVFIWGIYHHIKELRKERELLKWRKLNEIDYKNYINYDFRK